MTPIERRIERVEMAIAEAKSHLEEIKARHCISQGAFLCDAAKKIQTHASQLQELLVRQYMKKGRAR